MLPLVFVINGEEIRVAVDPEETIAEARDHALKESKNTGRAASEWEVRIVTGQLIDPDAVVRNLFTSTPIFGASGVVARTYERLYVSLQIGAGGSL